MLLPADGSSTVAKIAADLRPQSAHLWWPAVAKLQTASVLIACSCAMGQTDRSRYSKMPPRAAGIIMPRSGCFEA